MRLYGIGNSLGKCRLHVTRNKLARRRSRAAFPRVPVAFLNFKRWRQLLLKQQLHTHQLMLDDLDLDLCTLTYSINAWLAAQMRHDAKGIE